ncbi:MAG TPA: NAD(P)/FAD-dependent oxidoreductase, partial [Propionicimonas sp.]|nr:NAD(P)/FAD-dependent oxidoreductase [Propionicimonas sp.]
MTTSWNTDRVDTIIVGAGQAGLATAYYLKLAGVECLLLDGHRRVGDQWRERWDSLMLNTPRHRNRLPGMAFAGSTDFAGAGEFADYLEGYARHFDLAVRTGTVVTSIDRLETGEWRVTCADRSYTASNVVVATGGERHARTPDFADQLDPGIRQLHSSAYRNPGQLLPGPVLVVGAGQSGADLAAECARAGHEVWLSGRIKGEVPFAIDSVMSRVAFPVLWFLANHVLTERTPIGRRVKPAVRAGSTAPLVRVRRVDLDAAGVQRVEARTVGARNGMPLLADGRVLEVSNVLWCTGFGQDFSIIHPTVTDPQGWPTDAGGVMADLPGLFFMGLLFQRGFYSMLIGGVWRDARYIAGQIVARSA